MLRSFAKIMWCEKNIILATFSLYCTYRLFPLSTTQQVPFYGTKRESVISTVVLVFLLIAQQRSGPWNNLLVLRICSYLAKQSASQRHVAPECAYITTSKKVILAQSRSMSISLARFIHSPTFNSPNNTSLTKSGHYQYPTRGQLTKSVAVQLSASINFGLYSRGKRLAFHEQVKARYLGIPNLSWPWYAG